MRLLFWLLLLTTTLIGQQPDPDPLQHLAQVTVQPAAQQGLVVEVVDGKQAPRRAALVAVVDPNRQHSPEDVAAQQEGVRRWMGDPARQGAVISKFCATFYRTDENGRVCVPRTAAGTTVVHVFAGEAHDSGFADANTTTLRLTAREPRAITVTVVDAAGKPVAGVPVGIPPFAVGAGAVTDRDGRARLLARPGSAVRTPLRVALAVPLTTPVESVLADDAAEATLQAPPLASVRVIAYGSTEQPADDVESVILRADGGRIHYPAASRDASGGTFRVGLGIEVDVVATRRGVEGELTAQIETPANAGGLVVADLRQAAGSPLVTFQIADTTPLRDGEVVGIAFVRPKAFDLFSAPARADGTVRVAVPTEFHGLSCRILVVRAVADGRTRSGALEIDEGHQKGELRAGKVALDTTPMLCSGTVVDASGRPVAGAKVWPQFLRGDGMNRTSSGSGAFFLPTITTGNDGMFTLASVLPVTIGLAVAARHGSSAEPMPQATVDVRVVLP